MQFATQFNEKSRTQTRAHAASPSDMVNAQNLLEPLDFLCEHSYVALHVNANPNANSNANVHVTLPDVCNHLDKTPLQPLNAYIIIVVVYMNEMEIYLLEDGILRTSFRINFENLFAFHAKQAQ